MSAGERRARGLQTEWGSDGAQSGAQRQSNVTLVLQKDHDGYHTCLGNRTIAMCCESSDRFPAVVDYRHGLRLGEVARLSVGSVTTIAHSRGRSNQR